MNSNNLLENNDYNMSYYGKNNYSNNNNYYTNSTNSNNYRNNNNHISNTSYRNMANNTQKKKNPFLKLVLVTFCLPFLLYVIVYGYESLHNLDIFSIFSLFSSDAHSTSYYKEHNYPQSLIELVERNPETAIFVNDYPNYQGTPTNIDISGEVKKGEIPFFLQWDRRWGYEKYGDDFLAITGCGPTCLSMVYSGLTGKATQNPLKIANLANQNGYYVAGTGSSWSIMDKFATNYLGLNSKIISADQNTIVQNLKAGHPIICAMGPGDFTTTGHFIVIARVNSLGKLIIHDPNSKKRSNQTWEPSKVIPQIKQLWRFSL